MVSVSGQSRESSPLEGNAASQGPVGAVAPDRADLVSLNGTELRLWEWGDPSAPVVLCIHGAFDHGRMFDALAPRLVAAGYRVVAPDLRGHGDSGRLRHGQTWSASVLDIGMLFHRFGPSVGVIGHSMGGGQALDAAAVWPDEVSFVVNIDGLGPPVAGFDRPPLGEAAVGAFEHALKVAGRGARVFEDVEAMMAQRGAINYRLPEDWLRHLVNYGSVEVEGGRRWKWDTQFNVGMPDGFVPEISFAQFERVTVPVLALTGGEDDMWSEMSEDEIAYRMAKLPLGEHHVVPGGGHYLHLEVPEIAWNHIAEFIGRVDARKVP